MMHEDKSKEAAINTISLGSAHLAPTTHAHCLQHQRDMTLHYYYLATCTNCKTGESFVTAKAKNVHSKPNTKFCLHL